MTDDRSPTAAERWRAVARRLLPRVVLLAGVALVLLYTFRSRPSTVEVVYELGAASRGLIAARMVYRQGAEEAHRVAFNYDQHPAGGTQTHLVRLHEGDYLVEVTLVYAGQPPAVLEGERSSGSGKQAQVLLRRPLLVRGSGQVRIFLEPRRE
jgi:hypothetical protein